MIVTLTIVDGFTVELPCHDAEEDHRPMDLL